jgi:hypothetical protein
MRLKPTEPPGHARRKLRGLVSEIARLRIEGYSIRAIRQALAAEGIDVAWSSVQREVARLASPPPAAATACQPAARPAKPGKAAAAPQPARAAEAAQPGTSPGAAVDVGRYFDLHATNPLFRNKGTKP